MAMKSGTDYTVYTVTKTYGIDPRSDTLNDIYKQDIDESTLKLANRKDKTNILIKLESS